MRICSRLKHTTPRQRKSVCVILPQILFQRIYLINHLVQTPVYFICVPMLSIFRKYFSVCWRIHGGSLQSTPESIPITRFLPPSLSRGVNTVPCGTVLPVMICQCWRAKCHVGRIASRKPCRYYTSRKREACKLARQFFVRKIDATDI